MARTVARDRRAPRARGFARRRPRWPRRGVARDAELLGVLARIRSRALRARARRAGHALPGRHALGAALAHDRGIGRRRCAPGPRADGARARDRRVRPLRHVEPARLLPARGRAAVAFRRPQPVRRGRESHVRLLDPARVGRGHDAALCDRRARGPGPADPVRARGRDRLDPRAGRRPVLRARAVRLRAGRALGHEAEERSSLEHRGFGCFELAHAAELADAVGRALVEPKLLGLGRLGLAE